MGTRRKRSEEEEVLSDSENGDIEIEGSERAKTEMDYEQVREQRIKENKERMHKLGLFDLSLKLNRPKKTPQEKKKKTTLNQTPERRSSRIMTLAPVNYTYNLPRGVGNRHSSGKEKREVEIHIPEGTNPEVYTEEQEKLLGDCETSWELYVDGYDEDGKRIYDPIKGEKCHQCGHVTLGQQTSCNKCELPQGQLCGDCLYTRYGENVVEANANPKWTCPACRGICNCNNCRRRNGWIPTVYGIKVTAGFKSVAHYLIKTHRTEKSLEGSDAEDIVAEEISETPTDTNVNRAIRTRTRGGLRSLKGDQMDAKDIKE
ncbi:Zinc-finger domain of monoamine-oxidase A repressor R1 [Sesbania bispinosa]|nr:Zinc-finger domain of monoamine-oxidase A repressor R1 [Sesbania bispinosa]